jgi:hypothetical protein
MAQFIGFDPSALIASHELEPEACLFFFLYLWRSWSEELVLLAAGNAGSM